jgi:hypothetical protein
MDKWVLYFGLFVCNYDTCEALMLEEKFGVAGGGIIKKGMGLERSSSSTGFRNLDLSASSCSSFM